MTTRMAWTRAAVLLGMAGALGGCDMLGWAPQTAGAPVMVPFNAPAEQACPWAEGETYHPAVVVPQAGMGYRPPAGFTPGCAIIRFTVAADGRPVRPVLRAAYPLQDGTVALAALQDMRFQPGPHADTYFLVRLSLTRDAAGRASVVPDTRAVPRPWWGII